MQPSFYDQFLQDHTVSNPSINDVNKTYMQTIKKKGINKHTSNHNFNNLIMSTTNIWCTTFALPLKIGKPW